MATLTITFSAAHAARIQSALEEADGVGGQFVDENGDPRSATMADFKNHVIRDVIRFVLASERRAASRVAAAAVSEIDIT